MPSKREKPSHYTVYRDAAFLSQCDDAMALAWLKNRSVEYSSVFGTPRTPPESHALENILYRRNLPLIDLALAEYGRSKSVVERVYKRGNPGARVVACGNPSLFVGNKMERRSLFEDDEPLLWNIVRKGPLPELRAVCENPNLTGGFYGSLVSSWEGDEESEKLSGVPITSERFKKILHYLSRNPRVSTPREGSEERYYWDGFSEYEYNKLFTKSWRLAEIVPVDQEWAHALSKLYRPLYRPFDVYDDLNSVLERWRPDDEKRFSPSASVREEIAAKFIKPSIDTLHSDDPALRRAFYRTFDPESREFSDLDWTEWLERDEMCNIDLEQNEKIWRSSKGRQELEGLLWHMSRKHDRIEDIGFFREREEQHRKAHPEWFKDEDYEGDERLHEDDERQLPDLIANLERPIRGLAETVAKRRAVDFLWFLLAAFAGSFLGGKFW